MSKRAAHRPPVTPPECYRFVPERFVPGEIVTKIERIPGVTFAVRGPFTGSFLVPVEVGWLVAEVLAELRIGYVLHHPPGHVPITWEVFEATLRARDVVPEWDRDGVDGDGIARQPAPRLHPSRVRASTPDAPGAWDLLLPFQKDALARHATFGPFGTIMSQKGGAGKTLQLILFAMWCAPTGPIVIGTRAAARQQWASEVRRFTTIDPYVIRPLPKRLAKKPRKTPPKTLDEYLAECEANGTQPFIIVAWTSLLTNLSVLRNLVPAFFGMDEVHDMKSMKRSKSQYVGHGQSHRVDLFNRASAGAKLSKTALARCASTATLIKDRVKDVWAPYDLVRPGFAGRSSYNFIMRYCAGRPKDHGGLDDDGESNLEELRSRLAFFVVNVPYEVSHRELLGKKRRESWYLGVEDCGTGWSPAKIRAEMKRAMAASSPSAMLEVQVASTSAMKREPIVERILQEIDDYGGPYGGCKITVLDGRHENVEALSLELRKARAHLDVFTVHGGNTTPEQREILRAAYMKHDGPCVLVATGDSVGTSYNLHDTDIGIMAMLPWNGGTLHQWEARWFRLGMRRSCRVLFPIVRGTVDERFVARIIAKLPAMEKVMGDTETASAADALGGTDRPDDEIAREVLAEMQEIDPDLLED